MHPSETGHTIDEVLNWFENNNIEFFLTVTILVNENMIFNDDIYEFEQVGIPFLGALGRAVLEEIRVR